MKRILASIIVRWAKRFPSSSQRLADLLVPHRDLRKEIDRDIREQINQKIFGCLEQIREPNTLACTLAVLLNAGVTSPQNIHVYLLKLFGERRLAELERILRCQIEGLELVWQYHSIRLEHHRGRAYQQDDDIVQFFNATAKMPFLQVGAFNLAVQQCCITGNNKMLRSLLSSPPRGTLKTLSKSSAMGSARLLTQTHHTEEALSFLRSYLEDADLALKLYFLEIAATLDRSIEGFPSITSWRAAAALFHDNLKATGDVGCADFHRLFVEPLESISSDCDFMDARISMAQRRSLQDLIISRVDSKEPLSLIRLGDGEAYLFDPPNLLESPSGAFDEDNRVREIHWWGAHPSDEVRQRIKLQCLAAINAADILGIPSIYRVIRDWGKSGAAIGTDRARRGLTVVLQAVLTQLSDNRRLFTEERIHQILFSREFLRDLASAADRILVVSCWEKDDLNVDFLSEAEFINIPAHAKLKEEGRFEEQAPLFETFEDHVLRVRELSAPGTIVLIGAGLIGKIFAHIASEKGAVALDVGATMDYLAGRKTRSVADLV